MFACGKVQQRKRKSTRWRTPHCLLGNKSMDASNVDLTFDPNVISPEKRRRISRPHGNTHLTTINESIPESTQYGSHFEDDKENTVFPEYNVNTDSKNNLLLWESTMAQDTYLESDISTFCRPQENSRSRIAAIGQECTTPVSSVSRCATTNQSKSRLPLFKLNNQSAVATTSDDSNYHDNSNMITPKDGHSLTKVTSQTTILTSISTVQLEESTAQSNTTASKPTSRGILRLTIIVHEENMFQIQVTEAILDNQQLGSNSSCYIETMLAPDEDQASVKRSSIKSSNHLKFDDKITYNMSEREQNKRLMLSVKDMSLNNSNGCGKMVGCMSFGIKHLISKSKKTEAPVDGWYHLLPNHHGNRKHLACSQADVVARQQKVAQKQSKPVATSEDVAPKRFDVKVEKKLHGTQQFMITVPKVTSGYGFTIKGTMPVRVGRVKPDGAAESAGLISGDYILSINDNDTTSCSVETVANIVRNSTHDLNVNIARPLRTKSAKSPGCLPKSIKSNTKKPADLPESKPEPVRVPVPVEGATDTSCLDEAERLSNWGMQLSHDILGQADQQYQWEPELSVIREEKSTDLINSRLLTDVTNRTRMATPRSLWQPDLSNITRDSSRYCPLNFGSPADQTYEEIRTPVGRMRPSSRSPSWHSLTPDTGSSCQPDSFTETDATIDSASYTDYTIASQRKYCSEISKSYFTELDSTMYDTYASRSSWQSALAEESRFYQSYSSGSESDVSSSHHQRATDNQLPCPVGRQVAIHQLLTCEEDFTRMMKRGAQRFSRPLRHQLLSSSQHATLFQNIEKLVALSEFHIRQMINKSYCAEDSYMSTSNDDVAALVGQIYKAKMVMACEAYQMYYRGLDESLQLLDNLTQEPNFQSFLKGAEKARGYELSLSEFLQQPLAHFQQLVGCLGRVLLTTPQQHSDYSHIKRVMEDIHRCVARPDDVTDGNHGDMSSDKYDSSVCSMSTSKSRSRSQSMRRSKDSVFSSSSSVSSVDSEVVDLQQKLNFSSQVKPFQLAVPSRHVILSGDLMYVSDSSVTTRQVVLCSDLLLLTQKESKGQLKVVEEPILLQQIVQADFDCVNADEFRILFQKKESSHTTNQSCDWSVCQYKFRATNLEQKWAWKTVLGQRIKNVKSRADSAYVSMEEFV